MPFAALAPRGKAVLEIGAGVGLAGLACRACGAARVLLTDGEKRLVEELKAHHNQHVELEFEVLDWRTDTKVFEESEKFDLILGSDVCVGFAEGHIHVPKV